MWRPFWETFVTLVVIMDPIGMAPIFVALTHGQSTSYRRLAAVQAAAVAGVLVGLFALFGHFVLAYLHVSLESLTIAGGLLLMLVALEMFRDEQDPAAASSNVALVPLATPLLAGPGAIATVMVLSQRYSSDLGQTLVIAGILAAVTVTALGLLLAERLTRLMRPATVHFLTRILGLLLAAIAVQLVVDGVRELLRAQ